MTTIGLIGAGHIGSQIARLAVAHGHSVVISNSREPETLATLIAELGPSARAATAVEAAKAGDIVVVTIPLKNYRQVPVEPLAGTIVIDTNNYYPQRDGHIPELDTRRSRIRRTGQSVDFAFVGCLEASSETLPFSCPFAATTRGKRQQAPA